MKSKFFAAVAVALALCIGSANAQIKKTEINQDKRIAQGVKSGELTKAETVNLVQQEKGIHQEVKTAKSDGVITGAERKDIKQDQRQTSRAIYRKKHNCRVRH